MASEQVTQATEDNFEKLTEKGVSVVDFWADWCGPCHMLAPVIEQLAAKHKDDEVRVLKVNVDENPGLAARFGIHGIPTVVFVKDGKEVDRLVGVRPLTELDTVLGKHMAEGAEDSAGEKKDEG